MSILPRFILKSGGKPGKDSPPGAGIKVENIKKFLEVNQINTEIEGKIYGPFRQAKIWPNKEIEFFAVERNGYRGFKTVENDRNFENTYKNVYDKWNSRRRSFTDAVEGMQETLKLSSTLASEAGINTAANIIFEVERKFWQSRNKAGQIQNELQDKYGIGWSNHDHHTFRSSRRNFHLLIKILESIGFITREKFYAGAEAGWGAQVLEQPECGLLVFADVDLSPEELEGDFMHEPLQDRKELGTVGLWCALHGESMLSAGLHHLAGRFHLTKVTEILEENGIRMMSPFSNFPYLRQAFTSAEKWKVDGINMDRLRSLRIISDALYARFAREGAVGSHLENIQRSLGFKGFNQRNISDNDSPFNTEIGI
jgi:hypothetical protein